MTVEIPQYGLKAYALLFSKHGTHEEFRQSDLEWIVSASMRKKIFALLLKNGWIRKRQRDTYQCTSPQDAIRGLLEFRMAGLIKTAKRPYAFTQLSSVEIWSDYAYVQRSFEKSPYFIKVLSKDLKYWKQFFNANDMPNYVKEGATIGEFAILVPVKSLSYTEKDGLNVDKLAETIKYAKSNEAYAYAYQYIRRKHKA